MRTPDNGPYRSLYTYPWDLAEVDPAPFARRIGQCGLNAVTVAMSYHAGRFIRPHATGARVYFPEDGSIYFRHNPERYGRIRPLPGTLVNDTDVLRELAQSTPELQVHAWVVLLHNTPLGFAHPDVTVRNVFGDPYPYNLCPSHPDAREYAVALCADLCSAYPLRGLCLETPGFLPFEHGYHHEFAQLRLNPWAAGLLALAS